MLAPLFLGSIQVETCRFTEIPRSIVTFNINTTRRSIRENNSNTEFRGISLETRFGQSIFISASETREIIKNRRKLSSTRLQIRNVDRELHFTLKSLGEMFNSLNPTILTSDISIDTRNSLSNFFFVEIRSFVNMNNST